MLDPAENIVGANPYCFFGYEPFVAYKYLARAGITYTEIPAMVQSMALAYGLTNLAPEALSAADVQVLKEKLAALGQSVVSIAAFGDLVEPSHVEPMQRRIDFAVQLGAGVVLADAGGDLDMDRSLWNQTITRSRFLGDYAAERGVRLALEIHAGLSRNGAVARRFLDAVDHPAIGVNYDTGNLIYVNDDLDPAEDIKEIADRVFQVHLKDTTGGKGEWQFCALGDGRVNFPGFLEVLQARDFRGPYLLEIEGLADEDLDLAGHLSRVEKSLAYLRRIGLMPSA